MIAAEGDVIIKTAALMLLQSFIPGDKRFCPFLEAAEVSWLCNFSPVQGMENVLRRGIAGGFVRNLKRIQGS